MTSTVIGVLAIIVPSTLAIIFGLLKLSRTAGRIEYGVKGLYADRKAQNKRLAKHSRKLDQHDGRIHQLEKTVYDDGKVRVTTREGANTNGR